MKVIVKLDPNKKDIDRPFYGIYAIINGEEQLVRVYSFKWEMDKDDPFFGQSVAEKEAVEYAKKFEQSDLFDFEPKIIYQTPE